MPDINPDWNKSRGLACLIALFLGGFGAHWFYLERPKRGLLYLLFFWTTIPALLALIEIVIWAFMNEYTWHEKYEGRYYVNR